VKNTICCHHQSRFHIYIFIFCVVLLIVTPHSLQHILAEHSDAILQRINDLLEQKEFQGLSTISVDAHLSNAPKFPEPEDEIW
jgi:hypothetical protein